MRIGFGIDYHRLVEGRKLIIGGVNIPFKKGLLGHSDADVLVHAICDALLGAAALGDIGQHFPDTDEKYKNISSLLLLQQVVALLFEAGYRILNIDSTVVAQEPRMAEYINMMRENIADATELDISQISIKATTSEKMGPPGRGEGIVAYAICLIEEVAFD